MARKDVGAEPSGSVDIVTKGYVDPRTRQAGGLIDMGGTASGGSTDLPTAPATYFFRSSTLTEMTDFTINLPAGQTIATTLTFIFLTPVTSLTVASDAGSSVFPNIPYTGAMEYVFEPSLPIWYVTSIPGVRATQNGIFFITPITTADYAALAPADPNTMYLITDA